MSETHQTKMTPEQLAELQADIDFAKSKGASFFRGIRAAFALHDGIKIPVEALPEKK